MAQITPQILDQIRDRFAHVATCPFTGPRIFFENAGGALTLKKVAEVSGHYAAIPDNQGRANAASHALVDVITKAKSDAMTFFGASSGQVFVGESGTELIFRTIRDACLSQPKGQVLGSTLEHPATRSAATRWAQEAGHANITVAHDDAMGSVNAEAYAPEITPETRVATILHTSPVTGMTVDVASIAQAIRTKAPDCFIVVDGIQHAAHGHIAVDSYDIDAYVISPYKAFSRHGYGIAWVSDRLAAAPHDTLLNGPGNWELGTRDTGAYATFSEVVRYLEWLGETLGETTPGRPQIEAAARAIHDHEAELTTAMIHGVGNHTGLAHLPGLHILGGTDNPLREGLVGFWSDTISAAHLVEALNAKGIRCHVRKADHYSGNILTPLGLEACVRVSMCHYNSMDEVTQLLAAMPAILEEASAPA